MLFVIVPILLLIGIILAYEWRKSILTGKVRLSGKHVLITGGSSGIGKAIAVNALKRGASVSIFARNQAKLEETKEQLKEYLQDTQQEILTYSVDISKNYAAVENAIHQAVEKLGAVALLINCAGTSVSYRFDETPLDDFQKMMDVNYFGSINVTKAALQSMKEAKDGKVVFVSSLAGLLGMYGYTAYSASKFALVGFAEALQMELKPFNISVTVSFPPDTDTPGFEEEQKTKPLETKKISESGGLLSANQVANQTVNDALRGKFVSVVGIEGLALSTACAGMMPISSLTEAVFQVLTMGIFRISGILFLRYCDRTVMQCFSEKERTKKAN